MIVDPFEASSRENRKERRSVVGTYKLGSEDQKLLFCLNQIIPLIEQEGIAR